MNMNTRKKICIAVSCIACVFLSLVFSVNAAPGEKNKTNVIGEIIEGSALIFRNKPTEPITAKTNTLIMKNDRIKTLDASKVNIRLKDESIISLAEKTELIIHKLYDDTNEKHRCCLISVSEGKIRVEVHKSENMSENKNDIFMIKTNTAIVDMSGATTDHRYPDKIAFIEVPPETDKKKKETLIASLEETKLQVVNPNFPDSVTNPTNLMKNMITKVMAGSIPEEPILTNTDELVTGFLAVKRVEAKKDRKNQQAGKKASNVPKTKADTNGESKQTAKPSSAGSTKHTAKLGNEDGTKQSTKNGTGERPKQKATDDSDDRKIKQATSEGSIQKGGTFKNDSSMETEESSSNEVLAETKETDSDGFLTETEETDSDGFLTETEETNSSPALETEQSLTDQVLNENLEPFSEPDQILMEQVEIEPQELIVNISDINELADTINNTIGTVQKNAAQEITTTAIVGQGN